MGRERCIRWQRALSDLFDFVWLWVWQCRTDVLFFLLLSIGVLDEAVPHLLFIFLHYAFMFLWWFLFLLRSRTTLFFSMVSSAHFANAVFTWMPNTTYLKFISLNVGGLNNPVKRVAVLNFLCSQGAQIAMLQETQLVEGDVYRLTNRFC